MFVVEYKIDNRSKTDAIADAIDDTMNALAFPPKYIIIIINYSLNMSRLQDLTN